MRDVYCPKCDLDFEVARAYEDGRCPSCNSEFYWYEECLSDFSDCWDCVGWYENNKKRETKQVIIIRKDLNMRRGKEIAQGSHASNQFLIDLINGGTVKKCYSEWMNSGYKKVVLQCNSEQEILDIHTAAKEHDITSHIIEDLGLTEFNGVKTITCLALGPDYSDKIDTITGQNGKFKLKLY